MLIEILSNRYSLLHNYWYWIVAFVLWYIYLGVECLINGARPGWLMPFYYFGKDFTWSIPGGLQRRVKYLKENLIPKPSNINGKRNGSISGTIRWDYDWVADNNLYEDCVRDTLPGPFHFWFYSILCPILWPIALTVLAILFVVSIPLNLFESALEPIFDKYLDWREKRFMTRIEKKIATQNT